MSPMNALTATVEIERAREGLTERPDPLRGDLDDIRERDKIIHSLVGVIRGPSMEIHPPHSKRLADMVWSKLDAIAHDHEVSLLQLQRKIR